MTETLLTADGLSRSFDGREVVRGVSFEVPKGQSVGLLGPNGAGKTTIFRMLAGCLAPSRGKVIVAGSNLQVRPAEARRSIGYMPESAASYGEMTAREYLQFRAELSGRCLSRASVLDAVTRSVQMAHATGAIDRPIATLSKGYRQRMMLAAALVGDPPVLLLDEPTAGLDPNQVLEVRSLIRELSRDRAIVVSTHVLSEVEASCSHALILSEGKLIASGSLDELKRNQAGSRFRIVYRGTLPNLLEGALRESSSWNDEPARAEGTRALSFVESSSLSRAAVLAHFSSASREVLEFGPVRTPLDEIFASLTALDAGRTREGFQT